MKKSVCHDGIKLPVWFLPLSLTFEELQSHDEPSFTFQIYLLSSCCQGDGGVGGVGWFLHSVCQRTASCVIDISNPIHTSRLVLHISARLIYSKPHSDCSPSFIRLQNFSSNESWWCVCGHSCPLKDTSCFWFNGQTSETSTHLSVGLFFFFLFWPRKVPLHATPLFLWKHTHLHTHSSMYKWWAHPSIGNYKGGREWRQSTGRPSHYSRIPPGCSLQRSITTPHNLLTHSSPFKHTHTHMLANTLKTHLYNQCDADFLITSLTTVSGVLLFMKCSFRGVQFVFFCNSDYELTPQQPA